MTTKTYNIPVLEDDFAVPDYTLPIFESEHDEWYGYGHLNKNEFMANIRNAFGATNELDPDFDPEEVEYTYGVVYLPEQYAHLYDHFNPRDVDREFCAIRRAASTEEYVFPMTVWVA